MASERFNALSKHVPESTTRFVKHSVEIIDQVQLELNRKNWTQARLAAALEKSPSEVSKWLTPGYNFTMKTLAKLEAALGVDLLRTQVGWRATQRMSRSGTLSPAAAYRKEYREQLDTCQRATKIVATIRFKIEEAPALDPVDSPVRQVEDWIAAPSVGTFFVNEPITAGAAHELAA